MCKVPATGCKAGPVLLVTDVVDMAVFSMIHDGLQTGMLDLGAETSASAITC